MKIFLASLFLIASLSSATIGAAIAQTVLQPTAMRTAVQGGVADFAFSPDSKTLAVLGYDDSTLFLIATTAPFQTREVALGASKSYGTRSLAFTPDNESVLVTDSAITAIDVLTGTSTSQSLPFSDYPSCIAISGTGDTLLWLSHDDRVVRYDRRRHSIIDTTHIEWQFGYEARDRFVSTADLNQIIFLASSDSVVRLNLNSRVETRYDMPFSDGRICFSEPDSALITGYGHQIVRRTSGGVNTTIEGTTLLSQGVTITGRVLVLQGDSLLEFSIRDSTYKLLSTGIYAESDYLSKSKAIMARDSTIAVNDQSSVYRQTIGGNVALTRPGATSSIHVLEGGPFTGVQWSPVSNEYAAALYQGHIQIHTSNDSIRVEATKAVTATGVSYTPDGKYIASALFTDPFDGLNYDDVTIMRTTDLSDSVSGLPYTLFPQYGSPIFSPRGDALMTGVYVVTDLKAWKALETRGNLLTFSPDGSDLVGVTNDSVIAYKIPEGTKRLLFERMITQRDWRQMFFTPDRAELIIRTGKSLLLRDPASGNSIDTIAIPNGLQDIIYSPTGRMYAATSTDSMIYVWDARTHGLVASYKSAVGAFDHVEFNFDETKMLAWSGHRYVVFDAPQYRAVHSTPSLTTGNISINCSISGNVLNVTCEGVTGPTQLELCDVLGRSLFQRSSEYTESGNRLFSIERGTLPHGLYFVRIMLQNGECCVARVLL